MRMYTRGCIQDMSSNEPVLVKIFEVVKRWVTVSLVPDVIGKSLSGV